MKAKFEIKIAKELTREVDGNIVYEEGIYLDESAMQEFIEAGNNNEKVEILFDNVIQSVAKLVNIKL